MASIACKVAEMLGKTLFACPVYQRYGEMVAAKRHTPPGFTLELGLKDVEFVLKTGADARVPMPIAAVLRDRLIAGLAHGREQMDWSALALGRARRCRHEISGTNKWARHCSSALRAHHHELISCGNAPFRIHKGKQRSHNS